MFWDLEIRRNFQDICCNLYSFFAVEKQIKVIFLFVAGIQRFLYKKHIKIKKRCLDNMFILCKLCTFTPLYGHLGLFYWFLETTWSKKTSSNLKLFMSSSWKNSNCWNSNWLLWYCRLNAIVKPTLMCQETIEFYELQTTSKLKLKWALKGSIFSNNRRASLSLGFPFLNELFECAVLTHVHRW